MKKVLLTMLAVVATTGTFAQSVTDAQAKMKNNNVAVTAKAPAALASDAKASVMSIEKNEVLGTLSSSKSLKNRVAKAPKKAIASVAELAGPYQWDYKTSSTRDADPSKVTGTARTASVIISVADEAAGTVTLSGMFDNDLTGTVDLATGTLTIARQAAGTNDTYGPFDISGNFYFAGDDNNQAGWYLTDIEATIDAENKVITFADDIWFVRLLTEGQYAGYSLTPYFMPSSTLTYYDKPYYTKPAGALYRGWDKSGSGYYPTMLQVAPWTDVTFENASSNPATTNWHINYIYRATEGASRYIDVTANADENHNYSVNIEPGYYYAAPTIVTAEQTDSFTLSVDYSSNYTHDPSTLNEAQRSSRWWPQVVYADSTVQAAFFDVHGSGYGFGSLSTGYLYGTGTIDDADNGTGTCVAVQQAFPAPISPLYVEDIYVPFLYADNPNPLPVGKELTMTITGYHVLANGLAVADEDDVIAVLTATAEDVVLDEEPAEVQYTKTGVYYVHKITFTQKVVDELGVEGVEPIVLDRPFMVSITGWDQEGVNCGLRSHDLHDEDADMPDVARFVVNYPDAEGGATTLYHYYSDQTIPLEFTCLFDKVRVADVLYANNGTVEIPNTNVIKVSDDGETSKVDNDTYNIPAAYVYTATPWFDADDNEMYYLDAPEWITSVTVDDSNYKTDEERNNINYVSVTAEPLPADTPYREAEVYVVGRGVKSDVALKIYQGVKPADGVETVKTETHRVAAKKYNVAGQQVNDAFKGIVIENGKKVVR
ncbi:MAG: hypothetical protein IJ196_05680 [Prevotella sp.]|nr:hypothetical protein [Prevotella sp.]